MLQVIIALRQDGRGDWNLYSPTGLKIGGPFRGSQDKALEWGRAWISCWTNWTIKMETGNEEKN